MFNIALFEPEIPPNTGNIIRLCANTGCTLHLIHPLGFSVDDKHLRRAGLDYHQHVTIKEYKNFAEFLQTTPHARIFAIETCGKQNYTDINYQTDDILLFGPETRGLPQTILNQIPENQIIKIPMLPNIRSLNLSNAVAVVVYEAWRQMNFR
ncbi:MAG: tRNA (uridine(34)/cytosine(34)/5-carboxymethylaminomethyluridine(34)-2'-O)-methyltransferase TrmL [Gammaproteobacteria bacterium]|jgi:tRNA (cytidine/uridine-2'-O-)-methyltransferase